MNGYERTVNFVLGKPVDHPPFMPLTIEWVCRQYGVDYYDFVYDPVLRAKAYLSVCREYDLDCILPDADFSEQLEDFGQKPTWADGRFQVSPILSCPEDALKLPLPQIIPGTRQYNRLETLRLVAQEEKGNRYLFGICIGPFTEYCNARGLSDAMRDVGRNKTREQAMAAIDVFFQNCMNFIDAQMQAGADGIQIVEPNCSLISPRVYAQYIQPLHEKMVARIQRDGGFARLHICGNTMPMMPYTLGTGTHILDVDYQVDLTQVAHLLGPEQCFCGNLNTTDELLLAKPDSFVQSVQKRVTETGNRIILSGGCDVPADTAPENLRAFHDAVAALAAAH